MTYALVASALARHGSLTELAPDSIATVGMLEAREALLAAGPAEQRNTRRLLDRTPRVGPDERFVRMVAWAAGHGYVRPGASLLTSGGSTEVTKRRANHPPLW